MVSYVPPPFPGSSPEQNTFTVKLTAKLFTSSIKYVVTSPSVAHASTSPSERQPHSILHILFTSIFFFVNELTPKKNSVAVWAQSKFITILIILLAVLKSDHSLVE